MINNNLNNHYNARSIDILTLDKFPTGVREMFRKLSWEGKYIDILWIQTTSSVEVAVHMQNI